MRNLLEIFEKKGGKSFWGEKDERGGNLTAALAACVIRFIGNLWPV